MGNFQIKIFEKNGSIYRTYTEEYFKNKFKESKIEANFELMMVIEGLTFIICLLDYTLNGKEREYFEFAREASFKDAIKKIKKIIGKKLEERINIYRKKRNELVHNWLNIKCTKENLRNYSYDEALNELFNYGLPLPNQIWNAAKNFIEKDPQKRIKLNGKKIII